MLKKSIKIKKEIKERPDQTMSHILLNQHRHLSKNNDIAEKSLIQRSRQQKTAEHHLQLTGRLLDEQKKTTAAVKDMPAKKIEMEFNGEDLNFYKGEKGDQGEVGPEPADDRLTELIKPLIPAPIKGDKGDKHTDEEITKLIKPLIPEVKNGETPSEEKLLALIKPLIPEPQKGQDGEDGYTPTEDDITPIIKNLLPKEKEEKKFPTGEELAKMLKGKIKYDDIQEKPNLESFRGKMGGAGYLKEITDIDMSGLQDGFTLVYNKKRDKWLVQLVTLTPGINFSYVDEEQVSGSGTSWTLANTPVAGSVKLYASGQLLTIASGDYTISGKTITTAQSWNAGTIFADYRTGSASSSFIDEEQVSGSGTAWTLGSTPVSGSLKLYADGQRLTLAAGDYTIIGKNITTALSWSAGVIFADYRV